MKDEEIRALVSEDGSLVSRRLWYDEEVYRLEQSRVFGRAWLFLGHESQIPNKGDFVSSYMGEESVIVGRDRKGVIHAHLNNCRHRGLRICREDRGNAAAFTCPYHGWVYGLDGQLMGMPDQARSYPNGLDKSRWGLIPVARIESHRGLLFATFDPNAGSLRDQLGDMAFYLDASLNRRESGTELVGGVQKWVVDTNWKMPAENQVGDVAHGPISHSSVFELAALADGDAMKGMRDIQQNGRNVATGNGHGLTVRVYPDDADPALILPGEDQYKTNPEIRAYLESVQPEAERRLGPLGTRLKIATATVFPTFSILGSVFTVRVCHPRGPGRSEIWSWVLVDRNAPDGVKDFVCKNYTMTFGPGGIFEQDDGENWEKVTAGAQGQQARDHPFNFEMGLGAESTDPDYPGLMGTTYSEHTQRGFYRYWREQMLKP